MTALARQSVFGTVLGNGSATGPVLSEDILAHLELQLASARRLLAIVLEQGVAIRRRAIRQVVAGAGALQAEMDRRELLELERTEMLKRAVRQLNVPVEEIGFSSIVALMDLESAQIATSANAELRGMLAEISRQHELNRALMAQELSFLNHLLGLAGGTGGYQAPAGSGYGRERGRGDGGAPRVRRNASLRHSRVFDLEA